MKGINFRKSEIQQRMDFSPSGCILWTHGGGENTFRGRCVSGSKRSVV